MAQFYAKWTPLVAQSVAVGSTSQSLNLYNAVILGESLDLPFSPDVNYRIKSALKDVRIRINNTSKKISKLSAALSQVALTYRGTEQALSTLAKSDIIISPDDRKPLFDWEWEDTWSVIGSFGIIGGVISTIGETITGGTSTSNAIKTTKNTLGIVENISKALSDPSFDWTTLLGFDVKDSKSLSEALGDQLDDLNFGNAKSVASKVSVVAKWAGYALTAIMSAYDNFVVDTEGNSTGRKIAETIGEATVDIGIGVGIGVLGATVGAPAVVVAAVGVLVKWGADSICEHFTGKDFSEWASDKVLDKIEEIGRDIGEAAQSVADTVSGWWNKVFG